MASAPTIGLIQLVIIKIIAKYPESAFVMGIVRRIAKYRDVNDGQITVAVHRLKERGLIAYRESIGGGKKGRPIKMYDLTEDGKIAMRVADELLMACEEV